MDLIGLDDEFAGVDRTELAVLLRRVFNLAGGTHDDWEEYDRLMVAERRTVVLVHPQRVIG